MNEPLAAVRTRLLAFRAERRDAHLATLDPSGAPHSSIAPCVLDEVAIYVYLSRLSAHCRHLLAAPAVGVLLIGDSAAAANPFARQRLSYAARATVIATEDQRHAPVLDRLQARFGETVGVLRQLPDFVLFCLQPHSGTYIEGFGRAYELTGPRLDQLSHIDVDRLRAR